MKIELHNFFMMYLPTGKHELWFQKAVVWLLFFLAYQEAWGQNKKELDSLTVIYQKAKQDTTKLLVLNSIAILYQRVKPDTCISLAQKVLEKAEKMNFKKAQGNAYYAMGLAYRNKNNFNTALEYQQKSLKIREELYQREGIADCLHNIGGIYRNLDNYPLALEHLQKSLKIKETLPDKLNISVTLNLIGIIYQNKGDYPTALSYYQRSLKIYEEANYLQGISGNLNNIGLIYDNQKNYPLALEYHLRSLKIREQLNDKQGLSISLNNIGLVYDKQGKLDLALEYHQKSLKIKEELKDKNGIAFSLYNIGDIYQKKKNYDLALEYELKSLLLCEELGTKWLMSYLYNGLAVIYQQKKEYDKSIEFGEKGLKIAREIEALLELREATYTLYETYKLKGELTKALAYHEQYKQLNDSLFNVEKEEKIANLESTAKAERLEKDNQLRQINEERERNARLAVEKQAEADKLFAEARQEKDKHKQDSLHALAQQKQLEVDKYLAQEQRLKAEGRARELEILKEKDAKIFQQYIIYLILLGLVSVVIFAYFIFRSRQKERIAKEMVLQQNEEIQQINEELNITLETINLQKTDIEAKNKDISDSIRYAERIQKALLPIGERIAEWVGKEHFFIFYKPRNVVSGDFYFFEEVEGKLVVGAVDCTGHGVPGALMSMIGINLLEEIVVTQKITSPEVILHHLHKKIRVALKQGETKNADGMDLALITVDKTNKIIEFAGAKNPLLYVQNGQLFQIKGDKMPVGGEQREKERIFTKHTIKLDTPIVLYLFSDGYHDQFGGERHKKFMTSQMKELLFQIHNLPMKEQHQILQKTIEDWIAVAKEKQTDDMLIMGLRF